MTPPKHYLQIELPDVPEFVVDWIDVLTVKSRYWPEDRTLDIVVVDCDGTELGQVTVTCPEPIIECPQCGIRLDDTVNRGDFCEDCAELQEDDA